MATAAPAQVQVLRPRPQRLEVGGLAVLGDRPQPQDDDVGPPVRMPVSLNIDRHLRKAQGFLERENWSSAFQLLHDVIDGRTLTDDEAAEPAERDAELWDVESARQAVFSNDDRVFRPVKTLCHELLASLPDAGLVAYRTQFEFEAERELQAARAACDVAALERIVERHFVTLSAARALELAGDLRMDRGQFRAALQDYRVLLGTYPEAGRREAGVDDNYVRCKIALCYSMLGAPAEASETIEELTRLDPGAALRIEGELVLAASLAAHPLFAASARATETAAPLGGSLVLASELVPLWEFRFAQPQPYRVMREEARRGGFRVVESASAISVSPSLYAPGTCATIAGERVLFLDHFRARSHDALSGRMLLETDEPLDEKLRPDTARARVPVYDFATSRLATDGSLVFGVIGAPHAKGMDALLDNRLVAYHADTLAPAWRSDAHQELAGLTFLAAPTLAGGKLLVPILERGTFGLQALEAATGAPLYRVAIHRGGTLLARPTASPVAVDQSYAYALSNTGALAAIDIHTGSLAWIRRYERLHPLRPLKLRGPTRQENPFGLQAYTELPQLPGFAPSDIVTVDGMVVIAPCDGNVMLCLDGASGEPLWMLNRAQRVPAGAHNERWQYVLGHDGSRLLIGGDAGVTCVDVRTGVRRWRHELPSVPAQGGWRGRGTVARGHVLVPGVRELFVLPVDGGHAAWRRVPLPELSIGRQPLDGPCNLAVDGVYLTASYEGGIEVYSTVDSLLLLAEATESVERRSLLPAQAGDLLAAFATLEAVDLAALRDTARRADLVQRLLTIGCELATAMATHGARRDALDTLDRCRARLTESRDVKLWHLARIEVFQTLGDLDGVAAEQRALYDLMEGR